MALTDKLTAIADAIRGKTGGTDPLTLDQMPAEIAGIQAGGGDNLLDYAVTLREMFGLVSFPADYEMDITFCRYGTPSSYMLGSTFSRTSNLKSIKVTCVQAATTAFSMLDFCRSSPALQKVDLSGVQPLKPSAITTAFYGCSALKEIIGTFDLSECTNVKTPFTYCAALETISFAPGTIKLSILFNHSPLLTDETIQSIIDGLADLTDGTAQTLTLHATVGAKLTEEQIASATAKNWTISY